MGNDMTTPELPPLPEPGVIDTHIPTQIALYGYTRQQMHAYAESARAPLVAEVEKLRQTIAWLRGLIATVVERMEREDGPGPDAPGHCHEKPGVWDADNRREIAGKPCEWCHIWSEFKAAGAGKVETCDWCWKSVAEHGNG